MVVVLLVSAFAAVSCTQKESRRQGIVIAESNLYEASLFRQNCAICHGQEGNGKEIGGRLVPSLRYGDAAKKTDEQIYEQIKHGKLPMPAFENQLSEEDIRRMVKFIRVDLQARGTETPDQGN